MACVAPGSAAHPDMTSLDCLVISRPFPVGWSTWNFMEFDSGSPGGTRRLENTRSTRDSGAKVIKRLCHPSGAHVIEPAREAAVPPLSD